MTDPGRSASRQDVQVPDFPPVWPGAVTQQEELHPVRDDDGALRPLPVAAVHERHLTVIYDGVREYGRRSPQIILTGDRPSMLLPGPCIRRDLQIRRWPEIEQWIEHFGPGAELIRRWLALVPEVARTSAPALYLQTYGGTGKTKFAYSLAAMFGLGVEPMRFDELTRWGDGLEKSPIVLLDESTKVERPADVLREAVTRPFQDINPKKKEKTTIKGYLRILVAANSARVFSSRDNAELTDADRDAVHQRLVHVQLGEDASGDLVKYTKQYADESWTTHKIGEHVRWLHAERSQELLALPERDRVVGPVTEAHEAAGRDTDGERLALEFLTTLVERSKPTKELASNKVDDDCILWVVDGRIYIKGTRAIRMSGAVKREFADVLRSRDTLAALQTIIRETRDAETTVRVPGRDEKAFFALAPEKLDAFGRRFAEAGGELQLALAASEGLRGF
jgi:hypothetical protein